MSTYTITEYGIAGMKKTVEKVTHVQWFTQTNLPCLIIEIIAMINLVRVWALALSFICACQ
jgi:hypothetical protein